MLRAKVLSNIFVVTKELHTMCYWFYAYFTSITKESGITTQPKSIHNVFILTKGVHQTTHHKRLWLIILIKLYICLITTVQKSVDFQWHRYAYFKYLFIVLAVFLLAKNQLEMYQDCNTLNPKVNSFEQ